MQKLYIFQILFSLCTLTCILFWSAPNEAHSHVKFVHSRGEAEYVFSMLNLLQIFSSKYIHTHIDFFFSMNNIHTLPGKLFQCAKWSGFSWGLDLLLWSSHILAKKWVAVIAGETLLPFFTLPCLLSAI